MINTRKERKALLTVEGGSGGIGLTAWHKGGSRDWSAWGMSIHMSGKKISYQNNMTVREKVNDNMGCIKIKNSESEPGGDQACFSENLWLLWLFVWMHNYAETISWLHHLCWRWVAVQHPAFLNWIFCRATGSDSRLLPGPSCRCCYRSYGGRQGGLSLLTQAIFTKAKGIYLVMFPSPHPSLVSFLYSLMHIHGKNCRASALS